MSKIRREIKDSSIISDAHLVAKDTYAMYDLIKFFFNN